MDMDSTMDSNQAFENSSMEIEEQGSERNLDQVQASMDVASLNNLIVSMRGAVKRCRVQVINRLTHMIKKYRSKKGSTAEVEANQRKAERLAQEIEVLKGVENDKIAKFALGNTQTVEDAARQGGSVLVKVMTRVVCQKPVNDKVQKWRQEHDDWSALAAFVLTKNTGRRLKSKKKSKTKQQKATIAEADTVIIAAAKAVAMERSSGHGAKAQSKRASRMEVLQFRQQSVTTPDSHSSEALSSEEDGNVSEHECELISVAKDCSETAGGSDSDVSAETQTVQQSLVSVHQPARQRHPSLEDTSTPPKRSSQVSSTSGEMVIQKFSLDSLDRASVIDTSAPSLDEGFLLSGSGKGEQPNRPRDPFFADSDPSEDEEEQGVADLDSSTGSSSEESDGGVRRPCKLESAFVENLSGGGRGRGAARIPRGRAWEKGRDRGQRGAPWSRGMSRGGPRRGSGFQAERAGKGRGRGSGTSGTSRSDGTFSSKKAALSDHSSATAAPSAKLHPSWEASKKRKQQATAIQPFQGKKIKFDDDD